MNIENARFNMIEQQIRPWKVLDQQVLDLMSTLPREQFVPDAYQGLAFADIAIPLGSNRFMLHPREEGRLLQAVKPTFSDKVLVLGANSGFVTALLASMSNEVFAMDNEEQFVNLAASNLSKLNIKNAKVEINNAIDGLEVEAPFDVIVVLGSLQILPESIKQQLAVGGRLFCILGEEPTMEAIVFSRTTENKWTEECLFETNVPLLPNAPEVEKFHF